MFLINKLVFNKLPNNWLNIFVPFGEISLNMKRNNLYNVIPLEKNDRQKTYK